MDKETSESKLNAALDKIDERIQFIRAGLTNGTLTAEQAGIKLRSISIEVGTAACMPFRD